MTLNLAFWPILILSSHLRLVLPSGLFPSGFPTKILYTRLFSPICATCTAHLILLDLLTRTILGEQYRSLSSSFRSLLYSPVTSSLFHETFLQEKVNIRIIYTKTTTIWEICLHWLKKLICERMMFLHGTYLRQCLTFLIPQYCEITALSCMWSRVSCYSYPY